jgi:hypothetical protein
MRKCDEIMPDGGPCGSRSVTDYGEARYCRAHAVKHGLKDDNPRRAMVRKRVSEAAKEVRSGGSRMSKILVEDIRLNVFGEAYDISVEFDNAQKANILPMTENGSAKFALVGWLVADARTRIPQTLEEVSEALKITVPELSSWMRSREFYDVFNLQREHYMMARGRMVDVALLTKVLEGERWAFELYYDKFFKGKVPKEEAKNVRRSLTLVAKEYDGKDVPVHRLKSAAGRALAAIEQKRAIEFDGTAEEVTDGNE